MEVTYERVDKNIVLLSLSNDVVEEHAGHITLKFKLDELVENNTITKEDNLIIDLKDARDIYKHTLEVLISILKKIRFNNMRMVIITEAKQIIRVFNATALIKIFPIVKNLDEAIIELSKEIE